MKGLLLKDLYVLKDSLKVYLIIFLLYGYMGIVEGEIGLMYAMMFITSVVLPITSVSYDERCGWDRLANTMPVSRKQIVYSKYLLAFILLAGSSLVILLAMVLVRDVTVTEKLAATLAMVALSMLYQAIILPFILKLGSEKGRIIMMATCFAPIVLVYIVSRFKLFAAFDFAGFMAAYGSILPYVLAVLVAAAYFISLKISVKIYTEKEL